MKSKFIIVPLLLLLALLPGCTTTFFGTVVVLRFQDFVSYVLMALVLGAVASFITRGDGRTTFWICFLLSLVLTPLAGLIYCLVLLTKK